MAYVQSACLLLACFLLGWQYTKLRRSRTLLVAAVHRIDREKRISREILFQIHRELGKARTNNHRAKLASNVKRYVDELDREIKQGRI
jgi:hypothetical protein